MADISFDGRVFRIVKSRGENAMLSEGSLFYFRQDGSRVVADYFGGEVARGHLEGEFEDGKLKHVYIQYNRLGKRFSGKAAVEIKEKENGRLELIDDWEWDSGGKGSSVMEEVSAK